jgi:hypothetical protein
MAEHMCTIFTIVLPIAEITQPRLQRRRVVRPNLFTVGLNSRFPGNRRPLAAAIEEAEVDLRIRSEVIGLARLGIGVEDEVDAVVLLSA